MNYKLLVIDLDGTLLSKTKHISEKNLEALKKYTDKGGQIVLATGRAIHSTTKYKNIIEKYTGKKVPYLVSLCGSYIKSSDSKNDLFSTIDDDTVKTIDEKAKQLGLHTWIYEVNEINNNNTVLSNFFLFAPVAKIFKGLRVKRFTHNQTLEAFKINVFSRSRIGIANFAKFLAEKCADKVSFTFTGERHLEICPKNVDKGSGIRYVSEKLSIPLNQVAALGDTGNDLPAFKTVKFSATIGSSSDTLIANSSVDIEKKKNGVAEAIEKYILDDSFKTVKFFATDLDGTLLETKTKQPVDEAVLAVQKLVSETGPVFCIATGRNIADANRFMIKLNLDDNVDKYIIGDNGAILYSLARKTCIRFRGLPVNIANKILNIIKDCNEKKTFKEIGTFIHIYDEQDTNQCIASNYKKLIKKYGYNKDFVIKQILKGSPNFFGPQNPSSNIHEINHIKDDMKPTKFVMNFEGPEMREQFLKYLKSFGFPLEYSLSGLYNLELNMLNVSKGKAIKTLIEELQISPNQTMSVGDETNDITMLKMTEWSFCTSDSRDLVRNVCRYHIDSKPSYIVKDAIELYLKEYNKEYNGD